jgi:hypothetical protein
MPADTTHPVLQQPDNVEVPVWRYMDFAKYVSLLRSGGLHFARLDKMEDSFEGSITKAEYETLENTARAGEAKGDLPPEWKGRYLDVLLGNARNMRRSCYVNCWHMNEHESEAMWRLYSQSSFAIALKSRYSKLRDTLPTLNAQGTYLGPFMGKVTYVDHLTQLLPTGNGLVPVMNKRPSFAHERECRALIWRPEPDDYLFHPDPESLLAAYPTGIEVKLDLNVLIEKVVVSPLAPKWFTDSVADVSNRYEREWLVEQSSLAAKPYI